MVMNLKGSTVGTSNLSCNRILLYVFRRHYDEEDTKPIRPPPPDEEPEKDMPFAGLLHVLALTKPASRSIG